MSVNGINLLPPQLEINASVTKQMFNLEKTLVDKLLSSISVPNVNSNEANMTSNLGIFDLYKGNLIDIYV